MPRLYVRTEPYSECEVRSALRDCMLITSHLTFMTGLMASMTRTLHSTSFTLDRLDGRVHEHIEDGKMLVVTASILGQASLNCQRCPKDLADRGIRCAAPVT
jgi:hypothetical protein